MDEIVYVPFEKRRRPAELGGVRMYYSAKDRVMQITHADEDALGRIHAWLIGQIMLAKDGTDERAGSG